MGYICDDLNELKILIRCILVASIEALTIEELWKKVTFILGGAHCVQLTLFGYDSVFDFLKSTPDVVQLEDPENENSVVNLVSSELSRHMELLVSSNIIKPPSTIEKIFHKDLLIPYQTQCAFIRVFAELYPEGMVISDFISDVLCFPVFKLYLDCVELLLYNLDHIFKKDGLDTIQLQPTLVNKLKEVKENDKFTAMDVFNIDDYTLENINEDKEIANGLEYPLFNILEEQIKTNIELLLNEESVWISEGKICNLYINKFGSTFSHYRRWGFKRVSQMFSKLPQLCCVHFLKNDVEIISVKNHVCGITKKTNLVEDLNKSKLYISIKDKTKSQSEENDGIFKQFLRNDSSFNASMDDCFLDQEIQCFELHVGELFNVNVCSVNTITIPTLICQSFDKPHELQELLTDMKKFYFMNESKFIFDPTITMLKHTYAFFLDDLWFRGIVININFNLIKMINIDYGSIHNVSYDDIRILHKQFSQLPAQAFTCHLHGIKSINEEELSKIVEKKCTIYIVAIDQLNKYASVKIKFLDSTSDIYLNDEWIKNGFAKPKCFSNED